MTPKDIKISGKDLRKWINKKSYIEGCFLSWASIMNKIKRMENKARKNEPTK